MAALFRRLCVRGQLQRRQFRIYTRTGDKGTSGLLGAGRFSKAEPVYEALGCVDDVNAQIGLAREQLLCTGAAVAEKMHDVAAELRRMQADLLDVGASLAVPLDALNSVSSSSERGPAAAPVQQRLAELREFDRNGLRTEQLERAMDALDAELPTLKQFILPGGGVAAAQLHVARASMRSAERSVCRLQGTFQAEPTVIQYLNRASDFLFVAARVASHRSGAGDVLR
ncbi:Cob(I)yrinic acid a,c-diamide adenosyltransferase [Porphyridium purpureum]|uniref:Cob(I)yrinic acid a,c-diamide adenosyltransferase n=1 Tax=Porphyridium purpureum TaxID=35688 RepID=A0A5J4YSD1_PORPP|nr:Cob(I)yrinic acid a,c-diamide adenosyltransferase [Porphyridium purpureum]|eukprot:POR5413..scf236_6